MKENIAWTALHSGFFICAVFLLTYIAFADSLLVPKSISEAETTEDIKMRPSSGILMDSMGEVSNPSYEADSFAHHIDHHYAGRTEDQALNQAAEKRYGNLTYGDRTRPIRMFRPVSSNAQYEVSVSFRAPKSGSLSQVLLFWIYRSPHYAQGDGGRYIFELRSDDGTSAHAPGEEVLSRVGPLDFPLRDTWAWWPIRLAADLVEDKWYHVIFWNVHPSAESNYASYEYLSHENDSLPQGLDWTIWTKKYDDSSPWIRNDELTKDNYGGMEASILLQWEDNSFWGQGYISALADPPRPLIYGNFLAGEYFVADRDRIVNHISIRLSRIGAPKDNLYMRLESDRGQIILEKLLVTPSELPQFDAYDSHSKRFISMQLEPAVQLQGNSAYRLILISPNSDSEQNSYVLGCPVYSSTSVSSNVQIPSEVLTWQGRDRGYLITSVDGGNSWTSDPNADVSFYFSSPSPMDIAEDINRDGKVDCMDLQLCVNVFSGKETDPMIVARADVNSDGVVDISDIQQIIRLIMGR